MDFVAIVTIISYIYTSLVYFTRDKSNNYYASKFSHSNFWSTKIPTRVNSHPSV